VKVLTDVVSLNSHVTFRTERRAYVDGTKSLKYVHVLLDYYCLQTQGNNALMFRSRNITFIYSLQHDPEILSCELLEKPLEVKVSEMT
jgi:hypothetical protein